MELSQIIGIGAGILTAASMIPQVVKMFKEKKSSQVSVFMIVILIVGILLWIWYGILKDDMPIIVTNSLSLFVNLVMVVLRIKYRDNTSN